MIPTAFWLAPSNQTLFIRISHIATVISDPAMFGLTLDQIQKAYDRHGERLGIEGAARREIILGLVGAGCIRVRRYRNHYSVTVGVLDEDTRARLAEFATRLLGDGLFGVTEVDRWADVTVTEIEGEVVRLSLSDLAQAGSPKAPAETRTDSHRRPAS